MNKLDEILIAHDIDSRNKAGGTDKNSIHSYTDAYEKYLSPYVDKECSLLEIGVWHGGSSLLWYDYLPKSNIVGIDIANQIHSSILLKLSQHRYSFFERNAYVEETIATINKYYPDGFDIIIEDGIHTKESNEFAIEYYLPMLKKGGIMIIEDIPANPLNETPFAFNGITLPHVIEEMKILIPSEYEVEVLDLTNIKGRFDDILFIIKKP